MTGYSRFDQSHKRFNNHFNWNSFSISPNTEIHFVWKTLDPIEGKPRWPIAATTTFDSCPDVDVLAVGLIPPEVIADPEVVQFFRHKAEKASIVISICAGALLVGAAGLLEGRCATTNFHMLDVLRDVGATPVPWWSSCC